MTPPVHMKRPEGEAAKHYEEALRLERLIGDLTRDSIDSEKLEEAERLRGPAKEAWRKYREMSR